MADDDKQVTADAFAPVGSDDASLNAHLAPPAIDWASVDHEGRAAWASFAAAGLGDGLSPDGAADAADQVLEQYLIRFKSDG